MKKKITMLLCLVFTIFTFYNLHGVAYSFGNPEVYAYISFLKGEAYAKSSTQKDFGFLERNVPIEHGDELITVEDSFMEITFSKGIVIWVNSETFISITDMPAGPNVVLLNGTIFVQNTSGNSDNILISVETPSTTVQCERNSLIKVNLVEKGDTTIEVWDGNVNVLFENGQVFFNKGKSVFVSANGESFYSVPLERKITAKFEKWFLDRNQKLQDNKNLEYLDQDLAGSSYLSDHGEWYYDGSVSSYVWVPNVNETWRPYLHGRWSYYPSGYYWISYEPWGWAPYHYGSWIRNTENRWCWIPGYSFSPAWVVFISFGQYYGWAPLGYGYHPHYYSNNIHYYTNSFIINSNAFTFVHKDHFHFQHRCNNDSINSFQPLTEDNIEQIVEITPITQPMEVIEDKNARFISPEIKEGIHGKKLKDIAERFRNNFPRQNMQPVHTIFPKRRFIQRFNTRQKVIKPLKRTNPQKNSLDKRILQKREQILNNKKVRRERGTFVKLPKEAKAKKELITNPKRKKRLVNMPLKRGPIKIREIRGTTQ